LKRSPKVTQSTPGYQQHFSEILLQWSSALRSNTFTTVKDHLGHYETCGETLPFDTYSSCEHYVLPGIQTTNNTPLSSSDL